MRLGLLDNRFERTLKCAEKDRINDGILWEIPILKGTRAVVMPGYYGHERQILELRGLPRTEVMTIEQAFDKWVFQKDVRGLNVTSKPMKLERAGNEIIEWARGARGLGFASFDIFIPNPPIVEMLAELARERAFVKGSTMTVTSGYWRTKRKTTEMYEIVLEKIDWENPWPPTIALLKRIFRHAKFPVQSAVDHPYHTPSGHTFAVTEVHF